MHDIVENLLDTVTLGGRAVPYAHIKFTGSSPLYIVYSFLSETPAVESDDGVETDVVEIDVDIYAKKRSNLTDTIRAVKHIFTAAGWSWVEDSPELFEDDTGYIHRTITFEKERGNTWTQPSV